MFILFLQYGQLVKKYGDKLIIKLFLLVPSGNCGNLVGGLLQRQMGLPIKDFIAAQNDNDTLVKFLNTGEYLSKILLKLFLMQWMLVIQVITKESDLCIKII